MDAKRIRCKGEHPKMHGLPCGAYLFDAVPETVDIARKDTPPPGCVLVVCPRCGARYVVCERKKAA